jgi:hypothetical protein
MGLGTVESVNLQGVTGNQQPVQSVAPTSQVNQFKSAMNRAQTGADETADGPTQADLDDYAVESMGQYMTIANSFMNDAVGTNSQSAQMLKKIMDKQSEELKKQGASGGMA